MTSITTAVAVPATSEPTQKRAAGGNLSLLFEDFVRHVDASPITIRAYRNGIRQFFKYLAIKGISEPDNDTISDYKKHMLTDEHKSAATVNLYLVALRAFFKWTAERGLYRDITGNVKGKKIDRNFKKDCLSIDQAKAILEQELSPRDRAIFELAITCGLRTCEICRADVGDLRTIGSKTVLFVQGKGCESKSEKVAVPSHVERDIRKYLATREYSGDDEPLFSTTANRNRNGRLTTKTVSQLIKHIMVNAGYKSKRLTAHSLRHTAVTLALEAGHSIQEVSAFARHRDLSTTLIYSHNIDAANSTCSADVCDAIFN